MLRIFASILLGVMILFFALSPVSAGTVINIGFDFDGEVKSQSIMGESRRDAHTSYCLGGELYFLETNRINFGFGIEGLIPKNSSDMGRFYNVPTFAVLNIYLFDKEMSINPYFVSRAGYNFIYVDNIKSGYHIDGGTYYAAGIGFYFGDLRRNTSIELLYSTAASTLTIYSMETEMDFKKLNLIFQKRI